MGLDNRVMLNAWQAASGLATGKQENLEAARQIAKDNKGDLSQIPQQQDHGLGA